MSRRTPRHALVAALLVLPVGGTLAAIPTIVAAQTTVLHRAEIQAGGWNRVSELLEAVPGWGRASVDGFTFSASPDALPAAGVSAPGAPDWLVFIDDQPVQSNLFGQHLLELLPISIGEIDSVVFTRGPVIVDGTPAARGAILIFSRRLALGTNGELTYQHGDESGDPGPFRYTSLASPNIEKLGPFAHGSLGYAGARWSAEAGVHVASLNVTDTLIARRFPGTVFSGVRQDILAVTPTLRATADAFGGQHELLASFGDQRGILFIPKYGSEQSLKLETGDVGAHGRFGASTGTTIGYTAAYSLIDAGLLFSPLPFTVGHTRRHGSGMLDLERPVGFGRLTLGAAGDVWSVDDSVGTRQRRGERVFGRLVTSSLGAWSFDANAAVVHGTTHTTLDGGLTAAMALDSATSFSLFARSMHEHPEIDGTWIDAEVLAQPTFGEDERFSTGGIAIEHRFAEILAGTAEVRGERVSDWRLLDAGTPAASQPAPRSGTFLGGRARVATTTSGVWQGAVEYDHTSLASGDDLLRSAAESAPHDEFRAQVSALPIHDLRLTGIVDLMSATTWPTFASSGRAHVPPIRRVDGTIEKWFWSRHVRLQLAYRNVLDEREQYHPLGAQWNLRWHLSGTVRIPTG